MSSTAASNVSIGALSLTPTPDVGSPPLVVTFAIAARLSAPIVHWLLIYGDGAQAEGNGPPPTTLQHSYKRKGIYQPTLIVFQAPPFTPDAAQFLVSAGVVVGNDAQTLVSLLPSVSIARPPVATSFLIGVNAPARSSSWELVYGDGNTRTGTGRPPHFVGHTYATAGTYRAHLIVGGPGGQRYLASANVVIGGAVPPPPAGAPTGTVLVNGRAFPGGQIPYKSKVDVTNGTLLLQTDTGRVQVFGAGVFANFTLLRGTDNKKPIVEFRLDRGLRGLQEAQDERASTWPTPQRPCASSGATARASSAPVAATRRPPSAARSG